MERNKVHHNPKGDSSATYFGVPIEVIDRIASKAADWHEANREDEDMSMEAILGACAYATEGCSATEIAAFYFVNGIQWGKEDNPVERLVDALEALPAAMRKAKHTHSNN